MFAPLTLAALLGATASAVAQAPQSIDELPSDLRKAVVESTYGVVQDGQACSAPNPAQGMRSAFTAQGVQVAGDGETRGSWTLSLSLEAWGRTGSMQVPAPAEPTVHGRRVEYRRGALTEWYVNDVRGLEQGFTIEERPAGHGPIVIVLAVGDGFTAEIESSRRDALLTDRSTGALLHYSGLRAWDSAQRELEAALSVEGERLSIRVEDERATYPVHVDPWIMTEEAMLTASDPGATDLFGGSVTISGDTAVVGARGDDHAGGMDAGSAYVFVRSGTTWSEQAKLTASDGAANDAFGASVALSGDTVVVGAYGDDHAGGTDAGSAYVFVRSGTVWSEQQKLTASGAKANDYFGKAVAVERDTALVGAYLADLEVGHDAGSVHVFARSGTTWASQAMLTASDPIAQGLFGSSVAISGDTVVIGSEGGGFFEGTNFVYPGWAYVFVRSGMTWTQQQKLEASDGSPADFFGRAVAVSGNTAVIGASEDSHAGGENAGSAYVFVRSGTTWSEQQKLSESTTSDWFGISVAIAGDTAVVGSSRDDPGLTNAGSAYVFRISLDPPMSYCTAGISASGCTALIAASGQGSASAPSGFVVSASGVEGGMDGLFFFGSHGKQANPWGTGTSYQCVVPPVNRTGILAGTGTAGFCDGSLARDLNAAWCPSCPGSGANPGAGATVQAQLWYRDPLNTSNQTTSLSDAIEFVVAP